MYESNSLISHSNSMFGIVQNIHYEKKECFTIGLVTRFLGMQWTFTTHCIYLYIQCKSLQLNCNSIITTPMMSC